MRWPIAPTDEFWVSLWVSAFPLINGSAVGCVAFDATSQKYRKIVGL